MLDDFTRQGESAGSQWVKFLFFLQGVVPNIWGAGLAWGLYFFGFVHKA
jgi:hypothetical protein